MSILKDAIKRGEENESNNYERESNFFGFLLSSTKQAHKIHLLITGVGSFAKHKALEDYYTEVEDLTDELIEVCQGVCRTIIPVNFQEISLIEPLEFLSYVEKYIEENREGIGEGKSFVQNIIDEIAAVTSRTIYKITFLQ